MSLFAVTAIALAAIGLYGTLNYSVSLRRREVGLRIALGCVAGLALAAFLSKLLTDMLFGISRADLTSYLGVTAMVLLVASAASVIPVLRAARLDPMRALREE